VSASSPFANPHGGITSTTERGPRGFINVLQRILLSEELRYLPYGALLVVVLIAILLARGLYILTLDSPNLGIALTGVLLSTFAATVGVGVILFAYWKALTGSAHLEPFLLGALFFVVAIGFSVEAFSGLTWLLWKHDALDVAATTDLSLWDVEELFLWNVIDAVPLLDIPGALSWERPAGTSGFWVGAMLVGFRVAVIVPVIGLGALAFQGSQQAAKKALNEFRDDEWNVLKVEQRKRLHSRWDRFLLLITRGASGLIVIAVVSGIVVVSLVTRYLVTIGVEIDSSWVRYWLEAPANSSVTIPILEHEVEPVWLLEVGDVVASVLIFAFVSVAIYFLAAALLFPLAIGPMHWRIAAVVLVFSLIFLLCQALAAMSIALINMGFVQTTSEIPAGDEYRTSVEWFGWNAARLAPLVDVPSTTAWTLSNPYGDRWIGSLTVVLRAVMSLIVFWPVGTLVAITVEEAKLRTLAASRSDDPPDGFAPTEPTDPV
jgi:hypothetical protein